MEEINSLVSHGCKLARDVESNFPNLANNPSILLKSCDEIVRIFSAARERLNAYQGSTSYGQTSHDQSQMAELGGGMVQEWLRYGGGSQAMGLLLQTQLVAESRMMGGMERREFGLEVSGQELGSMRDMEGGLMPSGGGGGEAAQLMDVGDSGRGTSSSQRPRRRKDDVDKRRVMVPAPRMGNTEIPPEDGYTWRKYGQKEILGSRFPRGYYRCTHQKLYHCPAKKQVQRLDNDPSTFEVIYRGDHTCHMSSTAPSALPATTQQTTASPPTASVPLSTWLSMDFGLNMGGAGPSSGGGGGSGGAGPSGIRYGREADYQLPVADLADAMFNSGSSSSTSIDHIFSFSSMEDKWETGDKKNDH